MRWGLVIAVCAVAAVQIAVQAMTHCGDWPVVVPGWVLDAGVFVYWRAVSKVQP